MKFATFKAAGRLSWGIVDGGDVFDIGQALSIPTLRAALADSAFAERVAAAKAKASRHALSSVTLEPVIPDPDKILCVGLNYETHRKETGRSEVGYPTIFTRFADTQVGAGAPVVRPSVSTDFDFEGELALIIGKPGRRIARKDAFAHIAGFACYNDVSVRDWQRHAHQFTPGKNFPATGPFGPWMVTPDEIGPLDDLRIITRLNGDTVQEAKFRDMIFDVPCIIEYCSGFTRLNPGDVIATGTPGGVGARRTPPLWMKPGDVVEVEIDRIGILKNPIVAE